MPRLSDIVRQESGVRQTKFLPFEDLEVARESEGREIHEQEDHVYSESKGEARIDWYQRGMDTLENLASQVRGRRTFSFEPIQEVASGIVHSLLEGDQLLRQSFVGDLDRLPVVSNSLNVAILAIKIGAHLGYQLEELNKLAVASLLHDIGKMLLPKQLVGQHEELSMREQETLKTHPQLSADILSGLGGAEAKLSEIIVQEHERWGGQGYPNGLKGKSIHEYARIIGLADSFEIMVNQDLIPAHQAIRTLLTERKSEFSGEVLKALVLHITMFPIGTVVQLNTGEMGTVQKTNPQYPLRPILRMHGLDNRQESQDSILKDLSHDHLIHVVDVVHENKKNSP